MESVLEMVNFCDYFDNDKLPFSTFVIVKHNQRYMYVDTASLQFSIGLAAEVDCGSHREFL